MTKITLYQFEECPYCEKVRIKLAELGLKYKKVNVPYDEESKERKFLVEKSGVYTVPVIDIDGKFIGESQDIINYLEKNFKK